MKSTQYLFKKESFILLILACACIFFFFWHLGSYKLIDVDEPRYAEAAREMLQKSDWITPYFNYQLRFDKPILFYWLIAISYLIFGITEFAARFPSALLATGLVFFIYYFGKRTISKTFGLISALILASSIEFFAIARMSITDMTLAFFISATIFSGLLNNYAKESNKKYWWWLAYLFSGLAVLTKGPVGFLLPAMVLGIYFLLTGTLKENLKPKYIIPGAALLLAISVPWYYLIIQKHGTAFVSYFFLKHNLERFASTGFKQHHQPFYFYFIVIFVGFFPWITYLIASLIKYSSDLGSYIKNSGSKKLALFKNANNRLKVVLSTSIWFLTVFIFFSSSKAKLLTYILSLFPAISLLTGLYWQEYISENKHKKSIKVSSVILAVICFIIALIPVFMFDSILPVETRLNSNYLNIPLVLLFTLFPVLILTFINKDRRRKAFASTIIMMTGLIYIIISAIMPVIYNGGQRDLIQYVNYVKSLPDSKLYTYGIVNPSIVFYYQKEVLQLKYYEENKLTKYLSNRLPAYIIIKNCQIEKLSPKYKFYLLNKGSKYSLISNNK